MNVGCSHGLEIHNVWNKEPEFNSMIKDKLNSYNERGNTLVVVKQKLQILKFDLKSWDKDIFWSMSTTKPLLE